VERQLKVAPFLLVAAVAPVLHATAANFPLYHTPQILSSTFLKNFAQKIFPKFVQFADRQMLAYVVQYACKVDTEPSKPATKNK
jgi:hypothetical protein